MWRQDGAWQALAALRLGHVAFGQFQGLAALADLVAAHPHRSSPFRVVVKGVRATVGARGPFRLVSVLLLLFTANGIFEPLEVALNRAWNTANRSYLRNQLLSLGLIFACGTLAMASATSAALNQEHLAELGYTGALLRLLTVVFYKTAAVPVSMAILFLVY